MLTIRAVSFKGRPLDRELTARFEEAGGTIGRGETNTLVLSDPERFISRTHATIAFQAGGYVITDTGTKNPVVVNGRPLGSGSQARLGNGDKIKVGDYILEVAVAPHSAPQVAPAKAEAPNPFDPFADLLLPGERSAPRADPVIPPHVTPVVPTRPPVATPHIPEFSPDDPLVGIRGREPSIDELFGLKSSGAPDLMSPDLPLGKSPASGGVVDPLDVLAGTLRPVPPPSVPDHGHELFTPYAPPKAKPEPVLKPMADAAPSAPQPSAPPAPAGPPPQPMSVVPPGPQEQMLLRAFLQGAGIPGIQSKSLTPETMEAIGKLLREAVLGTLDLLRARGLAKSEMRADVTMIMAQDNNPLKFSPTVEAALTHLLAPQMHGFTPPLRAMKDAYDDLRAHQLGLLAGMRAALEEVFARFAPQELAKRLSDQSMLDDLLPMNRKAKLWDLFLERHAAVSGEAREDINAAFGKAFRRAYEAQVKKLRGGRA
ncbi:MAG: type VI secretion system-associated FHA domain protein TagH [Candidatus Rokuibacteriota bacterium]|nr:MAG: type VI secretion system-associated FHA domain protein TagH [Candidatus Rokubacteria bacterium]